MCKFHIMIVVLCSCTQPASLTQAQRGSGSDANKEVRAVTIALTGVDVTDKTLELSYQINNGSEQDIWVCEGTNDGYRNFEVDMAEDGHALLIRRRLDVPMVGFGEQPFGRYMRIRKSADLKESLLLSLPVRPRRVLLGGRRPNKSIQHAKGFVIEIGFYCGDLPGTVFDMLDDAEREPQEKHVDSTGYPTDAVGWLEASVYFNEINEDLQDRGEHVVIPWTDQTLKGGQVIRSTVDELRIPYIEDPSRRKFKPQNLSLCTRIEIRYHPSMLEYFFPYDSQRNLLSPAETKYLQSHKSVTLDDQRLIKAIADEINEGRCSGQIVTESRSAHIVCYDGHEYLRSFTVYGDASIVTEEKQYSWYRGGLQSLKALTPQVQPFDLRVRCAANLKDLWHRLRLYCKADAKRVEGAAKQTDIAYPVPNEWCDTMVQAYRFIGMLDEFLMRPHMCPSADKGKSHYAMNPNCKFDSPPEMVLLFETKAGWNQHGGPELFTFDNHDPKGGCVLLNDGTAKFIRTKEELEQLRWK